MNLYMRAFVNSLTTTIILVLLGLLVFYFPLVSVVILVFSFIFMWWVSKLEDQEKHNELDPYL